MNAPVARSWWSRSTFIILGTVCVLGLLRFAILDRTVPELTRGGRTLRIETIPAGTTISQTFRAEAGLLDTITIRGALAGTENGGHIEARVYDASNSDRPLGVASAQLTQPGIECCAFSFTPIPSRPGQTYRLDMTVLDLPGSMALSMLADTSRHRSGALLDGGLVINGRVQTANLALSASPATVWFPESSRNPLWLLYALFGIMDAGAAFAVYALLTSSDLRRP